MRTALSMALFLCACQKKPPEPVPVPEPQTAPEPAPEPAPSGPFVMLDGAQVEAWWDDGDTFSIANPEGGKRIRARLVGFNTLESYGPVHRWGDWTGAELYDLAKQAGERARSETWTCTQAEGSGGYGRILVDCPDLRRALAAEGLAHVFAIDADPDPDALAAQQTAIADGVGMWAKGAPEGLITSLHSLDEKDGQESTYNRVADLATGLASKVDHADTYETCEEVCLQGSCMVYVPFANRYAEESKAECLKGQSSPDNASAAQ